MDCSILDSSQKNELKNDLQFLLKQIIQKRIKLISYDNENPQTLELLQGLNNLK